VNHSSVDCMSVFLKNGFGILLIIDAVYPVSYVFHRKTKAQESKLLKA
jgi:hypothetical protein